MTAVFRQCQIVDSESIIQKNLAISLESMEPVIAFIKYIGFHFMRRVGYIGTMRKEKTASMNKKQAYQTIAKHNYVAYRTYSPERLEILILADSLEEAEIKAVEVFQTSFVTARQVELTENSQGYII